MKTLTISSRHKGFGLLEVMLVFAITVGAASVVFDVFVPAQRAAAADHDRALANTLASNAMQLFTSGTSVTGAPVMTAFNQYPTQFAPGFCSIDPATQIGDCLSALTAMPTAVNVMETNSTVGSSTALQSIGIRFQDLTVDQCQALLAGGTTTGGMSGVESDSITTVTPLTNETDVINFCTTSAAGSDVIDQVYLMYQPSSAPTTASASPPSTGPVIPPGGLPPFPPGWTPPWD